MRLGRRLEGCRPRGDGTDLSDVVVGGTIFDIWGGPVFFAARLSV